MKRALLGFLVVIALGTAVAVAQHEIGGQRTAPLGPAPAIAAGSELVVVPTTLGEKGQMLTVVDPRQRVMAVYHIELGSGKISLKSVRNIQWDLQVRDFNNANPLPEEIRSQLEPR